MCASVPSRLRLHWEVGWMDREAGWPVRLAAAVFVACLPLLALSAPLAATETSWVSRTLDPPIRLEGVRGIAESASGMLWFASWGGGLFSYDGLQFRRHGVEDGLPTVYLRDLHFDGEGGLWIASGKGVIRMRGGRFETFDPKDGFPIENVYAIAEDDRGRIFVAGEGGAVVIDRGRTPLLIPNPPGVADQNKVFCLHYDPLLQVLWQGWDNGLLVPIDLESLTPHESSPIEDFSAGRAVKSILRDMEGCLWVGLDYDLLRQDETGEWLSMRPDSAGDRWGVDVLVAGRENEIFMGSPAGVFLFKEGVWRQFDPHYIPQSRGIRTLHHSGTGSLWVGTEGRVTVLHRSPFHPFRSPDPFEHRLTTTLADRKGRLWVGGEYLAFRQGEEWTEVYRSSEGLVEHVTDLMETEDGRILSLWSNRGILEWREGAWGWLPPPPIEPQKLWTFLEALDGSVLVGTDRDGMIRWDGERWSLFSEICPEGSVDEFRHGRVYALLEAPDGDLLMGSEGGLHRLREGRLERIHGPMDGTEYKVHILVQPPGGHPLAGIAELGIFELQGDELVPVQTWEQGFDTNLITAIEPGPDGRLWVGTQAEGLYFRLDGGWFHLGLDSGLIPCTVESITVNSEGKVCFATDHQGVVEILPDKDPPRTRIDNLTHRVVQGEPVILTAEGNDRFERTASTDLRFSYRIDGGPWSPPTVEQPIFIASDQPGTHSLEVASIDLDGNRDPSPARENFVVVHPWQHHPVTLLLAAALGVNLILVLTFLIQRSRRLNRSLEEKREQQAQLEEEVRRRTRDLEELNASREKLITNVSHDFRTPLTNLIGYTKMLSSSAAPHLSPDHREFLDVIGNNASRMKRLIENVAQSLDRKDPRERFPLQPIDLREIAFDAVKSHALTARDQGIDIVLVCAETPVEIEGSDILIARLLDNLLSNAIKFSNPGGKIRMRIEEREDRVRLAVEDEGIGIHSHDLPVIFERFRQVHHGLKDHVGGLGIGLSICKEIADYHGAEIEVESSIEVGSVFTVSFPAYRPVVKEEDRIL